MRIRQIVRLFREAAGSRVQFRAVPDGAQRLHVAAIEVQEPDFGAPLILSLTQVAQARQRCPLRFRWTVCVLCSVIALVLAYCMLVFDGRYVLPITPLLIALSVRFAVPLGPSGSSVVSVEAVSDGGRWQTLACILLVRD